MSLSKPQSTFPPRVRQPCSHLQPGLPCPRSAFPAPQRVQPSPGTTALASSLPSAPLWLPLLHPFVCEPCFSYSNSEQHPVQGLCAHNALQIFLSLCHRCQSTVRHGICLATPVGVTLLLTRFRAGALSSAGGMPQSPLPGSDPATPHCCQTPPSSSACINLPVTSLCACLMLQFVLCYLAKIGLEICYLWHLPKLEMLSKPHANLCLSRV